MEMSFEDFSSSFGMLLDSFFHDADPFPQINLFFLLNDVGTNTSVSSIKDLIEKYDGFSWRYAFVYIPHVNST